MSTFIEIVLRNLMELLPFVVIFSYEKGVRWTFGRNAVELLPGLHWKIWFVHSVEILHVVEDFMDLPVQTVDTKDGVTVCFSATVGFIIDDPVKHYCEVTDFKEGSCATAMAHLAQRVREQEYQALIDDLKKLEQSLRGTLTTRLQNWGARVTLVGFINFSRARMPIRLIGGLTAQE